MDTIRSEGNLHTFYHTQLDRWAYTILYFAAAGASSTGIVLANYARKSDKNANNASMNNKYVLLTIGLTFSFVLGGFHHFLAKENLAGDLLNNSFYCLMTLSLILFVKM